MKNESIYTLKVPRPLRRHRPRRIMIFGDKLNRSGKKKFDELSKRIDACQQWYKGTKSRMLLEALSIGLSTLERNADAKDAVEDPREEGD